MFGIVHSTQLLLYVILLNKSDFILVKTLKTCSIGLVSFSMAIGGDVADPLYWATERDEYRHDVKTMMTKCFTHEIRHSRR